MEHISRMARNAASVLVNIAEGRGLLGRPIDRQAVIRHALLASTGCRIGEGRDRIRVFRGDVAVSREMGDDTCRAIAEDMCRWLRDRSEDTPANAEMTLPMGADEIVRLCGVSLPRMLVLLEGLRHVAFSTDGGAVLELTRPSGGASVSYHGQGGVHWHDGVVSVLHRDLPASLAAALAGEGLSRIVGDPALAHCTIRKVCGVDHREGVLRIVTMDEGHRVTVQKGR